MSSTTSGVRGWAVVAVASVLATSCSSGGDRIGADDLDPERSSPTADADPTPATAATGDTDSATDATDDTDDTDDADRSPSTVADAGDDVVAALADADLVIDAAGSTVPLDRRLFGTNVPAWAGPEKLADPGFRDGAVEVGTTLVRMPGGSWSNSYDWLGCELGDADRCAFTWAARPTDFVGFLRATGLPGSWTVNVNETAQSAAAAVAFFNGDPGDERPIGVDRNGVDWGTVGRWAQLRVDGGHPEPADVEVWEVGNEVFGGRPDAGGEECAPFGWEDVWTCDGTEYVVGDEDHDGFLAIRRAMIAVDPDIEVGAVGVAPPAEWGGFGSEVIEAAGDELDFYVVHRYGFDRSPSGDEALHRAEELWPGLIAGVRAELGADVPIAVTEHNLVAFENGDTEQAMTTAQNALYLADTLGHLANGGVAIGNQWNYANGVTGSGTDYGLIHAETYEPYPHWEALHAWSYAGPSLLPATTEGDLHVYPTRHDDGRLTIIVVNLAAETATPTLAIADGEAPRRGTLHSVRTEALDATEMVDEAPVELMGLDTPQEVRFPGWSINRLEVEASR